MSLAVGKSVNVLKRIDSECPREIREENGVKQRLVLGQSQFILTDDFFSQIAAIKHVQHAVLTCANKEVRVMRQNRTRGSQVLIGEVISVGGLFRPVVVAKWREPVR